MARWVDGKVAIKELLQLFLQDMKERAHCSLGQLHLTIPGYASLYILF